MLVLLLLMHMAAGHNFNRVWVITGGCLLWGIMTGGFSLCTVLWQVGQNCIPSFILLYITMQCKSFPSSCGAVPQAYGHTRREWQL